MDRKTDRSKYKSLDGLSRPSVKPAQPKPKRPERPAAAPVSTVQPILGGQVQTEGENIKQPVSTEPPFKYSYSPYTDKSELPSSKAPKRPKRKWSRKRKVVSTILVIFIIFIGISGWYGSRIIGNLDKVFHGNIFSDAQALFSSATLKGQNQGRVNILLAGDSADQIGHGGAELTDSILILSLNTNTHTAFLISIPRDLWVYVPGLKSWQK